MNILTKFKIHIITYCFFLLAFLCGYFKYTIYIFLIVFLHELGHVFTILYFHYDILKVEFYPFGGITKIDKPLNSSIKEEFIIASAGIIMQCVLAMILFLCQNKIRDYEIIQFYNMSILIFNFLPIIPLDGSVMLHTFCEKILPYEKAWKIYQWISCAIFLLFLLFNIFFAFHNYFICVVLVGQFFVVKKQEKYYIYRFYLERYLYSYPYLKIENHKDSNYHVLKRSVHHYFWHDTFYVDEKEVLRPLFEKNYER